MNYYQQPQPKQNLNWSLGKQWLHQGITLFQTMQKHWYATLLLVGLGLMILSMASGRVATMVLMLIMPTLTAWFYVLCRELKLYPNLQQSATQLWSRCWQFLVSRLNMLLFLGVLAVMLNYIMHTVQLLLLESFQLSPLTSEMVADMQMSEALLRFMINIMTGLPVALLMAFSPALVVFNSDTPLQAMIRSVKTVFFAWKPILSLTLWLMLLAIAAAFILSIIMGILAGIFGNGIVNIMMLLFMSIMMGVVFSANFVTYDALYPLDGDDNDDSQEAGSIESQESIYKEI